ncbi:MAG TPA: addiction module protein [Gammaproteobacteria bacterium]|jgi:putative addiction module component (TIGR02574 family)
MAISREILEQAMALSPAEKAELVDKLIWSLDKPDSELDKLWAEEAESRLAAYKRGDLKAVSVEEALAKYK